MVCDIGEDDSTLVRMIVWYVTLVRMMTYIDEDTHYSPLS